MTGVRDTVRGAARTRLYRDGSLVLEGFPVAEISDHLSEPDGVVWLDLDDPDETAFAMIREELGLHSLAIEDALQRHQRPKLDRYDGHLFLSVYSATLDRTAAELRTAELAVFATERALITVHWPGGFDVDAVVSRWDDAEFPLDGVGALLHGILDLVADGHLDTARELDDELDALEARLFDDQSGVDDPYRRAARLRRSLSVLRRVAIPMRDIVPGLLNREHVVPEHLLPYYRDVQDHVLHTAQWLDSLREVTSTIRESHLGVQSNRLNLVMKKVTGWAAIIAVPTAITGFYGQNVPYPGSEQPWGFWISTALICALSVGLYASFKRRDWL